MGKRILVLALFLLPAPGAPADAFTPEDPAGKAQRRAMKRFADGRKGLVVWESRRPTGTDACKYRIWKRNLDGTGLEMISGAPGDDDYAHFAPRISPNGRYVIFAGKDWSSGYDEDVRTLFNGQYVAPPYDVWIVEIDPKTLEAGEPREIKALRGRVGGAGEDHVFEWRDDRTVLVNLPSAGGIFSFDVETRRIGRKLVHCGRQTITLSPSGQYAICAQGGGAGYRRVDRKGEGVPVVKGVKGIGGCQVSISPRDDWLVWMKKPSRLWRLNLRTGEQSPLRAVRRKLPKGHDYIYFPALGRDMTLLAIGGSDIHSHGYGDYEIFLFPWDPENCRPTGDPVRYTFNDRARYPNASKKGGHALDRWPDVWVRNPDTSGDGGAGRTAGRAYPDLPLDSLDTSTRSLAKKGKIADALAELEIYTATGQGFGPAEAAKRDMKRLRQWAEAVLEDAERKAHVAPHEAIELFERIRDTYEGHPPGERAEKRLVELRSDEAFMREYEAWNGYRRLREIAKGFERPDGVRPLASVRAFQKANAEALARIRTIFKRLQTEYPTTRATLKARSLIHRHDIEVEMPPPADEKVTAKVEAVVAARSEPPSAAEIAPYTEALMTLEYRVKEVLSGQLHAERIVVVHLAMREGELLAPARFEEGRRVRLELGPWSAQSHYQSHPLADDVGDMDATYYFALSADPLK